MSDQGSEPVRPTGQGPDGPDPFSREGAAAAGPPDQPDQTPPPAEVGGGSSGAGASPAPWTSPSWSGGDPVQGQDFPLYGQPSSSDPVHPVDDPADGPSSQPSGAPYQPAPPYQASPPYQPAPPYQAPWAEQPPAGYGSAPDPYGPPGGYGPGQPGVPAPYGDPNAYGGAYGYGYGPSDHPAATPALVTGIIGLVLSLFCGFGGLVGIAGIVQGNRAKREIDGDPARWTGRSKAQAGMVTGIIGLVLLGLWTLVYVIAGIGGG